MPQEANLFKEPGNMSLRKNNLQVNDLMLYRRGSLFVDIYFSCKKDIDNNE